jgi:hypothetical protein
MSAAGSKYRSVCNRSRINMGVNREHWKAFGKFSSTPAQP